MIRVKICGIRRVEDADAAIEAGADALGFLVGQVHASPDFIKPELARSIVRSLPPFASTVLVTHLPNPADIIRLAVATECSTIQLHGDTDFRGAAQIREKLPYAKLIKALHVNTRLTPDRARAWGEVVDAILLDTAVPELDQIGGTGKLHDWRVSAEVVHDCPMPVILAGGLTPDNVQAAIKTVHPYGVDVNSGTKNAEGFKDPRKVKAFVRNAKLMADAEQQKGILEYSRR